MLPSPLYSLRRDGDYWDLILAGQPARLRHELGLTYAAYLLGEPPPAPIHALNLIAHRTNGSSIPESIDPEADPETTRARLIDDHAVIQQRSLSFDDDETRQSLLCERTLLQALLDRPDTAEIIRPGLRRDIKAVNRFLRREPARTTDAAQRAPRGIRIAFKRLCLHLLAPLDATGKPDPVRAGFEDHIQKHIVIPSARYSGPHARSARQGLAGCFTYEPPPGVTWTCSSAHESPITHHAPRSTLYASRSSLPLGLFSRINPHSHPSSPIVTTDLPRTLADFEQQFATEPHCRQYLFHLRWPDGFCCPACGGANASQIHGDLWLCHICHHKTSSTAGTLFQDSHLPLTTWFRACWHVVSEENGLSASGLQRALGLPRRKTAWTMLQKLRYAMVRPGQARLSGAVQLGMTNWAAQPIGESAPQTDGAPLILIAAEQARRGIGLIRLQYIAQLTPANIQVFVDETIEPGSIILTDDNRFARDTHGCHSEQNSRLLELPTRVATLLDFWLRRTYRGAVSPNHLATYLNEFTFRFNWRTSASTAELFYRLLQQSVQLQPAPFTPKTPATIH